MTQFIDAKDGTKLFYRDWGTGPAIVLIHGWPLNADMWEYQAGALVAAGHRVVAYDRRGFGRSGQPWSGYDYDTLASDLACIVEALDLTAIGLVGFSMGGGEAVRYAAGAGASRVSKLALVSAVTPYLLRTEANPSGIDKSVFDQMFDGLQADRPGFLATFGKAFMGAGLLNFRVSAAFLEWTQSMAFQASMRSTLACERAFSETDFRADCAAIRVPTLVIHGDADQTVPPANSARETVKLIPGAQLVEYPGAPHGLFYTERTRLNADLTGFFAH